MNYCGHCGKLKVELLNDPVVLLMGIYPKEIKLAHEGDICIPVLVTVLFLKAWYKSILVMDVPRGMNGISTMCAIYMMEFLQP